MRESVIETALKKRIKALGGATRKVKWIGVNGAPDQLVMLPEVRKKVRHDGPSGTRYHDKVVRPPGITFVELKRPKEDARQRQQSEHNLLREYGQTVLVIDTLELIDLHFPLP